MYKLICNYELAPQLIRTYSRISDALREFARMYEDCIADCMPCDLRIEDEEGHVVLLEFVGIEEIGYAKVEAMAKELAESGLGMMSCGMYDRAARNLEMSSKLSNMLADCFDDDDMLD